MTTEVATSVVVGPTNIGAGSQQSAGVQPGHDSAGSGGSQHQQQHPAAPTSRLTQPQQQIKQEQQPNSNNNNNHHHQNNNNNNNNNHHHCSSNSPNHVNHGQQQPANGKNSKQPTVTLARKRGRRRQQAIPEQANGLDRVFVWDIDGSLIRSDVIADSSDTNMEPSVLASVADKLSSLSKRFKELTLNFCEEHLFLSELESADQTHIDDVPSESHNNLQQQTHQMLATGLLPTASQQSLQDEGQRAASVGHSHSQQHLHMVTAHHNHHQHHQHHQHQQQEGLEVVATPSTTLADSEHLSSGQSSNNSSAISEIAQDPLWFDPSVDHSQQPQSQPQPSNNIQSTYNNHGHHLQDPHLHHEPLQQPHHQSESVGHSATPHYPASYEPLASIAPQQQPQPQVESQPPAAIQSYQHVHQHVPLHSHHQTHNNLFHPATYHHHLHHQLQQQQQPAPSIFEHYPIDESHHQTFHHSHYHPHHHHHHHHPHPHQQQQQQQQPQSLHDISNSVQMRDNQQAPEVFQHHHHSQSHLQMATAHLQQQSVEAVEVPSATLANGEHLSSGQSSNNSSAISEIAQDPLWFDPNVDQAQQQQQQQQHHGNNGVQANYNSNHQDQQLHHNPSLNQQQQSHLQPESVGQAATSHYPASYEPLASIAQQQLQEESQPPAASYQQIHQHTPLHSHHQAHYNLFYPATYHHHLLHQHQHQHHHQHQAQSHSQSHSHHSPPPPHHHLHPHHQHHHQQQQQHQHPSIVEHYPMEEGHHQNLHHPHSHHHHHPQQQPQSLHDISNCAQPIDNQQSPEVIQHQHQHHHHHHQQQQHQQHLQNLQMATNHHHNHNHHHHHNQQPQQQQQQQQQPEEDSTETIISVSQQQDQLAVAAGQSAAATTLRAVQLSNQHKQQIHRLSQRFHRIRTVYTLNKLVVSSYQAGQDAQISSKPATTINDDRDDDPDNNNNNSQLVVALVDSQQQNGGGQTAALKMLGKELLEILAEIDHYTLDWRKHALDCLRLISESPNCTNVIVTKLPLVIALGHLVCLGLSQYFEVDQIYSASKTNKEACLKRIKKRFGAQNRCSYIIVGGRDDIDMAKRLDLPSWNTSRSDGHRQLMQLYRALKEGFLM